MPSSRPLLSPREAEPPCPAGSWGLSKYPTQAPFPARKDRARATCTSFAGEGRPPSCKFWEMGCPPVGGVAGRLLWMSWEAGAAGVSAPRPGPPASLQKHERPLKGDHGPQLAHGAHYTSRTFRRLRMTSQMELMQSGEELLSVENIMLCQLSPKPTGFINIHLYF